MSGPCSKHQGFDPGCGLCTAVAETYLHNWSVGSDDWDGWTAPECLPRHLQGEVYGHPGFEDGSTITTSQILSTDWEKKRIVTRSRVYQLVGPPLPAFREWVEKNSPELLKNIL